MKTKLITVLALSWTLLARAQTFNAGTNDLAQNNWFGANTNFAGVVALSPTNEDANALWAVTRLLTLPQTPAGSNLLVSLGFPKTNVYQRGVPFAGLPKDSYGKPAFPTNYNSTNAITFFRTNVIALLSASDTNLAAVTDVNYTLMLSSNETGIEAVTVDYGDIQMLRALLAALEFEGYTLNANNFSVVLPQIAGLDESNLLNIQNVLSNYPSLLALQNTGDFAPSKSALTNAIGHYFAASAFIRARPVSATNRLFELDTNEYPREADFRTDLTNLLSSLTTPTEFKTNKLASTVNAGVYFAGTHSLRSLMPQFNGDSYVNDTLPDYTFGGILPYQPAYKTEELLRKKFHSYAGIYIGDGGLSDNNGGINGGSGGSGSFAVFVGTNQQATLMGHDDGDGSGNGNFGVIAQFAVDFRGKWQVNSNEFSGSGKIGRDGSFYGELDYTNGVKVYLNGYQQSPLGPYQNPAGLYNGTYNITSSTSQSGTLQVIVAADGEVFYLPIQTSPSGSVGSGGGPGLLNTTNNQFSYTQVSGSTISGTLNTNTLVVSGNLSVSITGTFSVSRSNNVPFDVRPVITTNLPASITGPLGTNVTMSVVATGSPPICYQWYSNGVAIPFATTNTYVVSNLLSSGSGPYSVSVNNAVGGTNSQPVTLVVSGSTLQILTTSLPNGTNGAAYNQALSAVGGQPPYNWTNSSGGLPAGLSLATNGVISGTPTTNGTFNFTAKVTDNLGSTTNKALSLTINPALLQIATTSLPSDATNVAYNQQLNATGGVPPYTWTNISGSLPPGLTLSASGSISGTPTVIGTNNFTVQVTDNLGSTASQGLSLIITNGPPLKITTTSLPNGTNGVPYNQTLSATGGNPGSGYIWTLNTGLLPAGLNVNTNGVISGTPTKTNGTSSFTVRVRDQSGATYIKPLTLVVQGPGTVVLNANDRGAGSLRQVIANGFSGEYITFTNTLSGQTITLTSGELLLNQNLTIDASGLPGGIAINGNGTSRVFEIATGTTVVLTDLTISSGYVLGVGNGQNGAGGGIYNYGTLTVNNCTLANNNCVGGGGSGGDGVGGGIYNDHGTLILNNSTVASNSCAGGVGSTGAGAGIYNLTGTLTMNNTTVANNNCPGPGAGIFTYYGTLNLTNSIVCNNASDNIHNSLLSTTNNSATSLVDTNALLAPLGNYGGPTPTMLPLPGSPAIDGCTGGTTFTTDQRGYPRIVGPYADIGAVEANPAITNILATTNITFGSSVTLSAYAEGTPAPGYQWYDYQANAIVGATNATLTLTNPPVTASGNYTVIITNIYGRATNLVAVTINPVSETPVLYGSAYAGSGAPASLYNINPTTGAATLIGAIGFNQVTGLGFSPDGILYGVGYNGNGVQVLLTINPATGAGTEVGATGLGNNLQDTAFVGNTLYAYSITDEQGHIYTINTSTGTATSVGNVGDGSHQGDALAYSASSGILFKADQTSLWTINQDAGAGTILTNLSYPISGARANGMDFDQTTETLWASVNAGQGGNGPNYLGTINVTNGQVTVIGLTLNGLNALAVAPATNVATPPVLTSVIVLGSGTFEFSFTNLTGASFTVFASTNVALPLNLWSNLGPAVESPSGSGQFQFTDPQATNNVQRFYRVRSP